MLTRIKNIIREASAGVWFKVGLLIRLALLFSFGSTYLFDYFIPFLDKAVLNLGANPWSLSPAEAFPYGSFLFATLFIPKLFLFKLFGQAALGSGPLSIFAVKLPLLFFDFLLYVFLRKLSKPDNSALVYLYWLNPILIYISYIYGQLDVISISLLIGSAFFIVRDELAWSAVFFACALLSKFQVALAAPLILVYIWNRDFLPRSLTKIMTWTAIVGVIGDLGFLPVMAAHKIAYVSTSSPEAYRLFAAKLTFLAGTEIYLGVFVVLMVLGRLCLSTQLSDYGLIYGIATLMGSLLLATNPQPGWYFWVVPFLALFFSQYKSVPVSLFFVFVAAYLLYFVVCPLLNVHFLVSNIVFTSLQTALAACLIFIFITSLRYHAATKNRMRPILIGLGGNSGVGKNYLSEIIGESIFGARNCLVVNGDDYHKWERGDKNWRTFTHLNPQANNLMKMRDHADKMAKGIPVAHPHYDHGTGKFTGPRLLSPVKTIIFQGLHSLYMRSLRDSFDLKIFLAPSEAVHLAWKVARDVKERGHTLEATLQSIKNRKSDSDQHIQPQKDKSDWIIEYFSETEIDPLSPKPLNLKLRYTMFNDEPVSDLIEALRDHARCDIKIQFFDNDIDRMRVDIAGQPTAAQVAAIAERTFRNLRQVTRGRRAPLFHGGLDGINQLFLLALLQSRTLTI